MFARCKNIINIDFTNFKTENIINMEYMFYDCNIKDFNLYSFNTINVKYMNYMFGYNKNLNELDISFFDTKNVIIIKVRITPSSI